ARAGVADGQGEPAHAHGQGRGDRPGRGHARLASQAAQKAGVDLASLHRRVSRLGRNGSAPPDAGPQLTRDDITRAAHKALEKCSRENSKWMRADLIANIGRVLPRSATHPDGQAQLLEDVADRALAGEFGPVVCLESPEAAPAPASLRRAD